MLQRVKELCRYLPGLEGDTRSRCCSQIVICAALALFRSAFLYVSAVQPALFQGQPLSLHAPTVLNLLFFTVYIPNEWLIDHGQVCFCRGECLEFGTMDTCGRLEFSV